CSGGTGSAALHLTSTRQFEFRAVHGGNRVTEVVEAKIQFPYKRSLGPVVGAFMTALTDRRIIGIRRGDRVIAPPLEWDPDTAEELAHDFVDVGPAGTVESWSWVASPTAQHPLDHPFAF